MAHRCGFTKKVLLDSLKEAGFKMFASKRRGYPFFDLWVVATKNIIKDNTIRDLAFQHIPK